MKIQPILSSVKDLGQKLKCLLRWQHKKQYDDLLALRVEIHPDKTYIGRIEKGFDFFGFHCCPTGVWVSDEALSRRDKKLPQFYEQGASKQRIGQYLRRWFWWVMVCCGLCVTVNSYGMDCNLCRSRSEDTVKLMRANDIDSAPLSESHRKLKCDSIKYNSELKQYRECRSACPSETHSLGTALTNWWYRHDCNNSPTVYPDDKMQKMRSSSYCTDKSVLEKFDKLNAVMDGGSRSSCGMLVRERKIIEDNWKYYEDVCKWYKQHTVDRIYSMSLLQK